MIFALHVLAGHSIVSLFLLFTLMMILCGLGINLLYKAVNDEKPEPLLGVHYEEAST